MFIWTFLVSVFGIGKLIAMGAILVSLTAFVAGVYAKGYHSCVSAYELANVQEELKIKTDELQEMKEAQDLGEALATAASQAERLNEDHAKAIVGKVPPGTGTVDAAFLRRLAAGLN